MFKPTHKKKSSINIIPMIDVIFFLLVFFMLFTTFRANPYGIEMQLPKANTVTEQEQQNIVINISENGDFFYNGERRQLSEIKNIAQSEYKKNENLVVIINADKDARYNNLVNVMDEMRQIGIYNLALAADRKE